MIRLAVGCAVRTSQPSGAHGAPYDFMDKSRRINKVPERRADFS